MPATHHGFWQRTLNASSSSVDWCEPNYVHSPFVAEMCNSISSLPLIALGLYGAYNARKQGLARRIVVAFLSLALVGLGATAFHATMLRAAQAADELPMIYVSTMFLYCLRFRDSAGLEERATRRQKTRWKIALTSFLGAFTSLYFVLPDNFMLFIVTFGVIATLLTLWVVRLAFMGRSPRLYRRFFWCSAGAMCVGFFLFWLPEHVLLDCQHPLQTLQLHSLFHLMSTMSGYSLALWLAYHLLLVSQREPKLERRLLVPRLRSDPPPPLGRAPLANELAVEVQVP